MDLTALEQIFDLLQEDGHIVLVSVLTRTGSTPAPLNAFLAVGSTSTWGTIGGGIMEAEALSKAREILGSGSVEILALSMTTESASEEGMLCGGSVQLLLEPVQPADLPCWSTAVDMVQSGHRGLFVVKIQHEAGHISVSRSWVPWDGPAERGMLQSDEEKALKLGIPRTITRCGSTYLLDPVVFPDDLLVFGAGHVAQALVPVGASIGFRCWVIDDRSSFASRERFPKAHKIVVDFPAAAVGSLPSGKNVWAVVMTRGHKDDAEVLRQLLTRPYRYVGMIGSRRKKEITFKDLEGLGIPTETLRTVHCPIGLALGGSSPAEIAISIAAELITVRYGTKLHHLQCCRENVS